jgi:nucleoside-diphosphate-sugar epimerase
VKIVVIGGTGLIGSKTVAILRQGGHEVVAASPKSGINTITGEGLKEAMTGAQVVIDLANSPSFEDRAVLEFFQTSAATCSQRRPPREFGTMSRYPLSALIGRPTMAISAPRSPKRN